MRSASAYFLKSPRLGFRLWSMTDLPLALALWGDPEVTRLLGGPFSQEQVREKLAREIENMRVHQVQYWPVFFLDDHAFAGCCGLRPYTIEKQIYELGFHFLPAHWGKGVASEAAQAVISYAFDSLRLPGLFAGHYPGNVVSKRVLEKLGFRFTHEGIYPPTGQVDICYWLERPR